MSDTKQAAITRQLEELGHTDIVEALKHMRRMRTALRVISTWAAFPPIDCRQMALTAQNALRTTEAK